MSSSTQETPAWRHLLLLPVIAIALWTGVRGIDFGHHWDEIRVTRSVKPALESGRILPQNYHIPSLCFEIALLGVLPDALAAELGGKGAASAAEPFPKLRIRTLFLVLVSLSIPWIYLLIWKWRRNSWEALFGAAVLGFAWEPAYHARFIVPDALMMQFGVLTLLCLRGAHRATVPGPWLFAAAATAGLTFGTKYPGGLMLLPVLIAVLVHRRRLESPVVIAGILAVAMFGAAFLLTTPGAVLETSEMWMWMEMMRDAYGGSFAPYDMPAGLPQLIALSTYLTSVTLSHYAAIAVGFSLLAGFGVLFTLREDARWGAVLLSFPIAYVLYFSTQGILIVRNLMVVVPFLALLAARGAGGLFEWLRSRPALRHAASAVLVVALAANAAWLVTAADSIVHYQRYGDAAELEEMIAQRPEQRFALSPRAIQLLGVRRGGLENVVADVERADTAVFHTSEVPHKNRLVANRPRYHTLLPGGPFEINFDYYPNWWGRARMVISPIEEARQADVPLP